MLNLADIYPDYFKNSVEINHLSSSSAEIGPHGAFFALMGTHADGHNFVEAAFKKGAAIAFVEHKIEGIEGLQFVVTDTYEALSYLAMKLYGTENQAMKIIGITGTDGKTSVATILEQMLQILQQTVGYIGTNGIRYQDTFLNLNCTTPLAPKLHEILANMQALDTKYLAMEVSSHALATKRVEHLLFDYSIFTNFSHDHLDFHNTLAEYAEAKKHLFTLLKPQAIAIFNIDDEKSRAFLADTQLKRKTLTFSIERSADLWAKNIKYSMRGITFELVYQNKNYLLETTLLGSFNISNILGASLVLLSEGFTIEQITSTITDLVPVEGRMEFFHNEQKNISAIVDFAHAPNAIKNVIDAARLLTTGRIIVITGAVGDGDILKRPLMGELCLNYADFTIFTTDQPYNETPEQIIEQMLATSPKKGNYQIIIDREIAIKTALDCAKAEDIVLVLGKAREEKIIYRDKEISFCDYDYVKNYFDMLK